MSDRTKVLIALGGNALQDKDSDGTAESQLKVVRQTAEHLAELTASYYEIAIVHGNGPQVGRILLRVRRRPMSCPRCRSMYVAP